MNRLFWIIMAILGGGLILLFANHDSGTVAGFATDDFGRMVYLGALAVVFAVAIFGSGVGFGRAVRSMAVWAAIVLVLMGGYQYRYELQDIASRMTAGLIPGSPISLRDNEGRAAVMLDRLSNGHFEVRAEVNGAPVTLLVDTGATNTVLSATDAGRAGIDAATLDFIVAVMTANGEARAARATADEIRVGEIARSNLPMLVAEPGRLDRSLLGMNFINTLSGFDMRGERLILRD